MSQSSPSSSAPAPGTTAPGAPAPGTTSAWAPFSVLAPAGVDLPDDTVTYGPDIPTEAELKLLGNVTGKRILDLGCGAGRNAIALARAGARTIAVDESPVQVAEARAAIDAVEDVKVELHQSSMAELAFLRADTIDGALCVYSLNRVSDIGRVFRQLHRVLRTEKAFVLSVPHPTFGLVDPQSDEPTLIRRKAFEPRPYPPSDPRDGTWPRSVSTLFTELSRAGFRVDNVLEPEPKRVGQGGPHWTPVMAGVPATLILRARKEGI